MNKRELAKAKRVVRRIADEQGWRAYTDGNDGDFELETWSPAGENVVLSASGGTVLEVAADFHRAADAFDPEEHAGEIFLYKRRGSASEREFYRAAPDSLHELLEDAAWIDAEQRKFADALCEAAGADLPKLFQAE